MWNKFEETSVIILMRKTNFQRASKTVGWEQRWGDSENFVVREMVDRGGLEIQHTVLPQYPEALIPGPPSGAQIYRCSSPYKMA
jgi:hypothetical protein